MTELKSTDAWKHKIMFPLAHGLMHDMVQEDFFEFFIIFGAAWTLPLGKCWSVCDTVTMFGSCGLGP